MRKINFDPVVIADGIAPTDDPILLFRSPAYAISSLDVCRANSARAPRSRVLVRHFATSGRIPLQ
jgi:hypothetical protein